MINFEKIKFIDIDDLADYLMAPICGVIDDCPIHEISCHDCIKSWLLEEDEDLT